jgi:hypothetical protein
MASRFTAGAKVYTQDGRSYVVEAVDGSTVYCTASNGAESEFPESALLTETQWAAKANGRRDVSYTRLKQSRLYTTISAKTDTTQAEQLLIKADRLEAGVLDFVAYHTASRVLTENKDEDLIPTLSIVKSRDIFDTARADIRAELLASVLATSPQKLIDAMGLGDNLLRAMIQKGLATHGEAFEDFVDKPRR